MSLDIIEIALSTISDDREFEKLASEVMREEGYTHIMPLGSTGDEGLDALQGTLFVDDGAGTAFQYSLQEKLASKVRGTVRKLRDNGIKFSEFVYVTPRSVGSARQLTLIRDVRKEFGVALRIFERQTLVNRLSDYDNGMFHRHFPNIEKQLSEMVASKPLLARDTASALEVALLRSSVAYALNERSAAARKSIVDHLVIAIVASEDAGGLTIDDVLSKADSALRLRMERSQAAAAYARLEARRLIVLTDGKACLTTQAAELIEGRTARTNEATASLVADVIGEVVRTLGEDPRDPELATLRRNALDVLELYFRLYGTEIAGNPGNAVTLRMHTEAQELLVREAAKGLRSELGDLLMSSIASMMEHPTPEQAVTLKEWAFAYVGIQVMNLDPALREFQATRLAKKTFILDTDFILDCIVEDRPISKLCGSLVDTMVELGCKVVVPEACLDECIDHARVAPSNYAMLGDSLLSLTPALVDSEVSNVFVQGYYHAIVAGSIAPTTTFREYLSNYLEPQAPRKFIADVVRSRFPQGVDIRDPSSEIKNPLPTGQVEALSDFFYEAIATSQKGLHRTQKDNRALASTDARLFLTTYYLGTQSSGETAHLLGGSHYLVTCSSRYTKGAAHLGMRDSVTASPQALSALFEFVGASASDPEDFMSLLQNPLLSYAVNKAWPDAKALVESGVDLRGKSVTRLNWDFQRKLHANIVRLAESEVGVNEDNATDKSQDAVAYTDLLKSAAEAGYRLRPDADSLLALLTEARTENLKAKEELAALTDDYTKLEAAISTFGKRRQAYLRRLARRQSSS